MVDSPLFLKKETRSYKDGLDIDFQTAPVLISGSLSANRLCGDVPIDDILITEFSRKLTIVSVVAFTEFGPREFFLENEIHFDPGESTEASTVVIHYSDDHPAWRLTISYNEQTGEFDLLNRDNNVVAARVDFYAEIEDNRGVNIFGKEVHHLPLFIKLNEARKHDIAASARHGQFLENHRTGDFDPQVPFKFKINGTSVDLANFTLPVLNPDSHRRDLVLAIDTVHAQIGNKTLWQRLDLPFGVYVDGHWSLKIDPITVQEKAFFLTTYDPENRILPLSADTAADIADYIDPIDPPKKFSMRLIADLQFKFDGVSVTAEKIDGCMILKSDKKEHRILMGKSLAGTGPECSIDGFTLKIMARKK